MPSRNEILGALCFGFLMLSVGVVWLFGPVGLISCGAFVVLSAVLAGFIPSQPQPKKKEVKK